MRSRTLFKGAGVGAAFSLLLGTVSAFGAAAPTTVGPRSDGTAVAPTGHRITPAGRQTPTGAPGMPPTTSVTSPSAWRCRRTAARWS
jgi:hypothetical protein